MNIAIAGYGVEGEANYRYWSADADHHVTIVDEREQLDRPIPNGAKTRLGEGAFEQLDGFDLVVRTAGLAPYKLKTTSKIWTATNEFFSKCPVPIIGVTGTKGKGTTASLIASIFEAAGKKVWLVGNIGVAALDVLDAIQEGDIVIYELSSFQLWDSVYSPQTAVVLGIEPEHLDVHTDFEDYVGAKANICRFQKSDDFCVYKASNEYSRALAQKSLAEKQSYGLGQENHAHVKNGFFYVGEQIICSTKEVQLRGDHNLENTCAAVAVAFHHGVHNDAIAEGLRNFKGLEHRLEKVAVIDDVTYYNDSFSSAVPATIAAVRSFHEPEVIIIGGIDRGGDFDHLASTLATRSNIREVILIGEIRHKLSVLFATLAPHMTVNSIDSRSMEDIVAYAHARARPGDVVVLSPGCASFDMFKDFYDRGIQFKRAVHALTNVDKGLTFSFESYDFDESSGVASFHYAFDDGQRFVETISFERAEKYDRKTLDAALRLAFLVIGTSYIKTFPSATISIGGLDEWQASFLNSVYQEGLSQFAFENHITRDDLPHFAGDGERLSARRYKGNGVLSLQSGGKDSLLIASLLAGNDMPFTPWYVSSSSYHPKILDDLGSSLVVTRRAIDSAALKAAAQKGGKNGHVPITYIIQSLALIQAVLLGKNQVLVAIAHEGEEPHATIGDLSVTHQWSKMWESEKLFAEYVRRYISSDISVGSPLRKYSELRVAELFVQQAWEKYGRRFSSCNVANYRQAADNSELHWCGECSKCANSFLLFAPFVESQELMSLFAGQNLFTKPSLTETFKGLLSIDGVMRPFECIGETEELRLAYHLALKNGYDGVTFEVPESSFDYLAEYPLQPQLDLFS